MKNLQQGFIGLAIAIIVGLVLIGSGTYVYLNKGITKSENKSYSITDILKNDVLKYAGASKDRIVTYKTEGYLISKTISVIYPCSTPGVCAPPIPSIIKIGFSENATSTLTIYIWNVDSEKKAKKLEEDLQVGHYYEFILEPGQYGPVLTDFRSMKVSNNSSSTSIVSVTLSIEAPFSKASINIQENGLISYFATAESSSDPKETKDSIQITSAQFEELSEYVDKIGFWFMENKGLGFDGPNYPTDGSTYIITASSLPRDLKDRALADIAIHTVTCYSFACESRFVELKNKIIQLWGKNVLEIGV